MVHRVDIELSIEDSKIIERAEEQATQELTKQLKSNIFEKGYSWGHNSLVLSNKAEEIVKNWLNENKESLYEAVATKVAKSMLRSAKFRDILEEKING